MQEFKITDWLQELLQPIVEKSVRSVLSEFILSDKKSDPATFLNAKQAAEFLQLSINTVYSKTSKKEIPHIKRGKKLVFKRADLEEWLNEGKNATKAQIAKKGLESIKGKRKEVRHG